MPQEPAPIIDPTTNRRLADAARPRWRDVSIHDGNPFGGTAADVDGSLIFPFGTDTVQNEKYLDRMPAWPRNRPKLVSDQIRQAIDDSGLTRYRIAQETGISETALALFYNGHRGLSMKALNCLGEFLQLKITLAKAQEERQVSDGQYHQYARWTPLDSIRRCRRQTPNRFGWARLQPSERRRFARGSRNCLPRK